MRRSFLFIASLFIAGCIIPLLLNQFSNSFPNGGASPNSQTIRNAISSSNFHDSMLVCVSVCIPMLIDLILFGLKRRYLNQTYFDEISGYTLCMILSILVPNFLLLSLNHEDYAVFLSLFLIRFFHYIWPILLLTIILRRTNLIILTLGITLNNYEKRIWNEYLCLSVLISHLIGGWANNLQIYFASASVQMPLEIIMYLGYISMTLLILISIILWLRDISLNYSWKHLSFDQCSCVVYIVIIIGALIGFWIVHIDFDSNLTKTNTFQLCTLNYFQSVIIFLIIYVTAELNRRKAHKIRVAHHLEIKNEFIRYVSHEIRTPLNTVVMGLKYLHTDLLRNSEHARQTEWVEIVEDLYGSCESAVEILNNLLTYEKLATNALTISKKKVYVRPFLEHCFRPYYLQAGEAGVDLRVEFQGELQSHSLDIMIDIDRSKISQVVRKLLSNALKFTSRGGRVDVTISPSIRPVSTRMDPIGVDVDMESSMQGATMLRRISQAVFRRRAVLEREIQEAVEGIIRSIRIDVTDYGLGISVENQQRLFKEIVQFNAGELQDGKGSGLGLWISHQIMRLHGGDISVRSAGMGRGSTFTIELPICTSSVHLSSRLDMDNSDTSFPMEVQSNPRDLRVSRSSKRNSTIYIEPECGGGARDHSESPIQHSVSAEAISDAESTTLSVISIGDSGHHPSFPSPQPKYSPTARRISLSKHVEETESVADSTKSDKVPDRRRSSANTELDALAPIGMGGHSTKMLSFARVLVVDDAVLNRRMMKRVLNAYWTDIDEAENGQTALEMVSKAMMSSGNAYDIVLMDYQMPGMDGPTAARLMRNLGFNGIIIGVTGNVLPIDIHTFLTHGADRVLNKPLDIEQLKACLNDPSLLEKRLS